MKYGIRIIGLDITNYTVDSTISLDNLTKPRGTLNIRASVNAKAPEKELAVKVMIQFYLDDPQDEKSQPMLIGSVDTLTEFLIDDWDNLIKRQGNLYLVDNELKSELIRIAYDSTRGLVRQRGENHLIGKIVLPVFDPNEISPASKE
ncbi:hypothetical protein [Chitinophaga sp. YIM B06452]|uniref:hypothetical protein n=1 Tax=Chitinophaga sp. YIM B06452 TaxID=3082158 RepID=UPI0031FE73F6